MRNKNPLVTSFLIAVILFVSVSVLSLGFHSLKPFSIDISSIPLRIISLGFAPFRAVQSCIRCLQENKELKKTNEELRLYLILSNKFEDENKRLRKLLSFKEKSPLYLVPAKIIGGEGSNFQRSVLIDRGKDHKVASGNIVITPEGLFGRVIEAGRSSSRVTLINDPDFSMAAKVKRSGAIGLLSGSLGGGCNLRYLELDEDIKEDDEIVSSSRDGVFLSGIPVGRVVNILKEHSGLMSFAIIEPAVKINAVEEALVIVDEQN